MEKLIIAGKGVNAKRALEFINRHKLFEVMGFAVNKEYLDSDEFCGLPVYDLANLTEIIKTPFKVFVAVYWNHLNSDRRKMFELCEKQGYEFASLISPLANIFDTVKIGKNCWIFDLVTLNSEVEIADNTYLLPYTFIGANTKVDSHCFLSVRTLLGGGSYIGKQSFLGFNAVMLDCTTIGEKCIVSASALVKRNMPSFSRWTTDGKLKQYSPKEIEEKLVAAKNVR